jgi:hypothetical protein
MDCNVNNCTRAKAALTFLALCLLLSPAVGRAHFPAHYGKEFVRSEPARQGERPRSPTVPVTPMDETDADSYKQQVKAQELLDGPYAQAVTDPLSSLARYHRDRGEYLEAEDLYERALHIVRVNDGLYSERQIPLVRGLMNVYRARGDLKALDDRYHYFFGLYGRGQPPYTALRKRASLEYLRWQRAAHSSGLDGGSNKRLVETYQLNRQMLKSVAQTPNVEHTWYRELVLSQIQNLYLLLGGDFPGGASSQADFLPVQQQMSILQRSGLREGRYLLQGLIAQSAQLDPIERASLHLELGDWYQWNEIRHNANEEYAKVEQIMLEAGELDLLDQWLGAPVELPANDAFRQPNQLPSDAKPVVATVHFDISAKGRLRYVEVSTKEPEDTSVGLRIKSLLIDTHFRPRFVSGHAEPVEQLTRQYQLVQ